MLQGLGHCQGWRLVPVIAAEEFASARVGFDVQQGWRGTFGLGLPDFDRDQFVVWDHSRMTADEVVLTVPRQAHSASAAEPIQLI